MTTREELRQQLGDLETNELVPAFKRFAFIPHESLERLAGDALSENWGRDSYVLLKYIAVHVPWSIQQGLFIAQGEQFVVTAGHLQTRYGTPLYLVFERNRRPGAAQPWFLKRVGSDVGAPSLPTPPEIPAAPAISPGLEIVMMHDHIIGENADRVPFLKDTPRVAQMCAVAGAIQWSINRSLHFPYWYFGRMAHLVPLYLQSRENITQAPDAIAPIQVGPSSMLVRTVLLPHMPYANARVAVKRHDQLPPWLLDAWHTHAESEAEPLDDPEPAPTAVVTAGK